MYALTFIIVSAVSLVALTYCAVYTLVDALRTN